ARTDFAAVLDVGNQAFLAARPSREDPGPGQVGPLLSGDRHVASDLVRVQRDAARDPIEIDRDVKCERVFLAIGHRAGREIHHTDELHVAAAPSRAGFRPVPPTRRSERSQAQSHTSAIRGPPLERRPRASPAPAPAVRSRAQRGRASANASFQVLPCPSVAGKKPAPLLTTQLYRASRPRLLPGLVGRNLMVPPIPHRLTASAWASFRVMSFMAATLTRSGSARGPRSGGGALRLRVHRLLRSRDLDHAGP